MWYWGGKGSGWRRRVGEQWGGTRGGKRKTRVKVAPRRALYECPARAQNLRTGGSVYVLEGGVAKVCGSVDI